MVVTLGGISQPLKVMDSAYTLIHDKRFDLKREVKTFALTNLELVHNPTQDQNVYLNYCLQRKERASCAVLSVALNNFEVFGLKLNHKF